MENAGFTSSTKYGSQIAQNYGNVNSLAKMGVEDPTAGMMLYEAFEFDFCPCFENNSSFALFHY